MEPKENVINVCKECSTKRREEFQETLTVQDFQKINSLIKEQKPVYVKVVFSERQEVVYNDAINVNVKYNLYADDEDDVAEHMWVLCGDVSLEHETICGILENDPFVLKSLKYRDIVVFRFEHIEGVYCT